MAEPGFVRVDEEIRAHLAILEQPAQIIRAPPLPVAQAFSERTGAGERRNGRFEMRLLDQQVIGVECLMLRFSPMVEGIETFGRESW